MIIANLFIKCIKAEKAWLEGELPVLSFLNGKAVIPRRAFSVDKWTDISQTAITPTPLPRFSPTSSNPRKNRPGKRERMRKKKMSEYVEELIQNDDLTSQEFPVDEVIIKMDENGKFIGFITRWSNTTESPYSFVSNPKTLKERCREMADNSIEEIQEKLREFAKDYDGKEFLPES